VDIERVAIVDVEREETADGARSAVDSFHLRLPLRAGEAQFGPVDGKYARDVIDAERHRFHVPRVAAVRADDNERRRGEGARRGDDGPGRACGPHVRTKSGTRAVRCAECPPTMWAGRTVRCR